MEIKVFTKIFKDEYKILNQCMYVCVDGHAYLFGLNAEGEMEYLSEYIFYDEDFLQKQGYKLLLNLQSKLEEK